MPLAAQTVWTDPSNIRIIEGRGDTLFGATPGGLVTWHLPQGSSTVTTTAQGLPSNDVIGVHLNEERGELLLRTANGLARGWPGGSWDTHGTQADGAGERYDCAISAAQTWFLGGASGRLLAWQDERSETLQIPTQAKVVGLALAAEWAARLRGSAGRQNQQQRPPTHKAASLFPPGILAATDDDGLWLLRSLRPVRWLRLGELEGLPSDHLLHVVLDDSANAWVATRAGIARVTAQLQITAWPQDALLSQRALTMKLQRSGFIHVGWWGGLFRIVTQPYDDEKSSRESSPWIEHRMARTVADPPLVELLPGIHEAIVSTAWANALWWTAGDSLTSYLGATVHPPRGLPDNHVLDLTWHESALWSAHPHGQLGRWDGSSWHHFGVSSGLPEADLNSLFVRDGHLFVGTDAGLWQQIGLGTGSRFQAAEQGPQGSVHAQAMWQGSHWVGGSAGLWESDASGWWWTPLWPGASEVRSLSATAETLWVAAGAAGIAARVEDDWIAHPANSALAGMHCEVILSLPTGEICVGTEQGVVRLDGDQFELLAQSPAPVHSMSWHAGTLFVGSDLGVFRYDNNQTWRFRGVLDAIPAPDVTCFSTNNDLELVVGTHNGAGSLDPQQHPTDVPMTPARTGQGGMRCYVAERVGHRLQVSIPQLAAKALRVFDVRGRSLGVWAETHRGIYQAAAGTHSGMRLARGLYFGRCRIEEGHQEKVVRILIPR